MATPDFKILGEVKDLIKSNKTSVVINQAALIKQEFELLAWLEDLKESTEISVYRTRKGFCIEGSYKSEVGHWYGASKVSIPLLPISTCTARVIQSIDEYVDYLVQYFYRI